MKNFIYLFILATSFTLSAQVSSKIKPIPNSIKENRKSLYLNTIDPAVVSLEFKTIKLRTGDLTRIIGTIKNKGGKNFSSNANQQQIQLWEIQSSTNRKMIKQMPFTTLNSSEQITIEFERPAFKSSKEFPPDYQVVIVYDPDILSDANYNNDDAVMSNNQMTKNPFAK